MIHEGKTVMNETSALIREAPENSLSPSIKRTQRKDTIYEENDFSQDIKFDRVLILVGFLGLQNCET